MGPKLKGFKSAWITASPIQLTGLLRVSISTMERPRDLDLEGEGILGEGVIFEDEVGEVSEGAVILTTIPVPVVTGIRETPGRTDITTGGHPHPHIMTEVILVIDMINTSATITTDRHAASTSLETGTTIPGRDTTRRETDTMRIGTGIGMDPHLLEITMIGLRPGENMIPDTIDMSGHPLTTTAAAGGVEVQDCLPQGGTTESSFVDLNPHLDIGDFCT